MTDPNIFGKPRTGVQKKGLSLALLEIRRMFNINRFLLTACGNDCVHAEMSNRASKRPTSEWHIGIGNTNPECHSREGGNLSLLISNRENSAPKNEVRLTKIPLTPVHIYIFFFCAFFYDFYFHSVSPPFIWNLNNTLPPVPKGK